MESRRKNPRAGASRYALWLSLLGSLLVSADASNCGAPAAAPPAPAAAPLAACKATEDPANDPAPVWQANPVHQYADAAACQLGGREEHYLPKDLVPGGNEVPVYWNERRVKWFPANTTTGTGEYKILGDPADDVNDDTKYQPGAADFPEQGAGGPFVNNTGAGLRCDHFPYVEPSCNTGQYLQQLYQGRCAGGVNVGKVCRLDANENAVAGFDCPTSACTDTVRWQVLFRRKAAPAQDTNNFADWGGAQKKFFPVVDAGGLKPDTQGVVWLDTLNRAMGGLAAANFTHGFRCGPIPRAGGLRPELREEGIRASVWFDSVAEMGAQQCTDCHGSPFNGSDWLKQTDLEFQDDEARPYWHAGNDVLGFAEKKFFNTVTHATDGDFSRCGGCHNGAHKQWMLESGSTPGGETARRMPLARLMSMVHDPRGDNPSPLRAAYPLASSFRADKFGGKTCVTGTNIGASCDTNVDCAGGGTCGGMSCVGGTAAGAACAVDATCLGGGKCLPPFGKKDARRTHVMPSRHNYSTVDAWNAAVQKDYNVLACCGANLAGVAADPPNTFGKNCYGGTAAGILCSADAECGGGGKCLVADCKNVSCEWQTKGVGRFCAGGTNAGAVCADDTTCTGGGKCQAPRTPPVTAQKPDFYTPWMASNGKVPSAKVCTGGTTPGASCDDNPDCPGSGLCTGVQSQLINAPDAPFGVALTSVDCTAAPVVATTDPKDKCYQLAWSDPNGSAYSAPPAFRWVKLEKKVSEADWTQADRDKLKYCADGSATPPIPALVPNQVGQQIAGQPAGNQWRFSYTSKGLLPTCKKVLVRLCGAWCEQDTGLNQASNARIGRQVATDEGQVFTLANGDATAQTSIERSGFRKNLGSGRFVQTLTLQNAGTDPISAPVSIVLDTLSTNATLFNKSGSTTSGDPYITADVGSDGLLTAGETAVITLEFTNPTNQGITYGTRQVGGCGDL